MHRPRRALARPSTVALIAALAVGILPGGVARPAPASAAVVNVFFSEYIEGSSNNKALEIYNGTGEPLNLGTSGYQVRMYFNGSATAGLTINLTGTVAAGDVFVLAQSSANATILAQADQTNGSGWFNGDDAVELYSSSAGVLDVIGQIGSDPGSEWGTGVTSTADNTLRRKSGIAVGDADGSNAFDPSLEWDGFAVDTLRALGAHPGVPPEAAPAVSASTPTDGATNVPTNTPITVTFSEAVTVDDGGATIDCVDATFSPTADATVFEFVYLPPIAEDTVCTITITGAKVHDVDGDDPDDTMAGDVVIDFRTVAPGDPCVDPFTPIGDVQGSGATSPLAGTTQTIQGIVVGDYEGPAPTLRGFFVQDAGDGDTATSDGVFVFNGSANSVSVGDHVRVTGNVAEFQGQTQLSASSVVACSAADPIEPTDVTFPAASSTAFERYEGMLIRLPQTMVVTETFNLGRFGQVTISAGSRLQNPTAVVAPGAQAAALQAENDLRKIILDDGDNGQNVDPIVFGRGGLPLTASNTLRGGDTATDLVGVMTWTFGGDAAASPNAWRIRPTGALGGAYDFEPTNPRPGPTVQVEGDIRVAGMNLLNYFNTFDGVPDTVDLCTNGVAGGATDCRGADTLAEFARQWPKTVAAILSIDADVIGVNEIENDGYGPDSALADLVGRLNDATAPGTYAYIDVDGNTGQVDAAGTDAIKVGLLYRPAAVTPVGDTAVLNTTAFVNGGDAAPRSRPSIAQAFESVNTGARFIVDVNHLKSKGSACAAADAGDGQGNCNLVRTVAAEALGRWLLDDPTGTGDQDILIVGDLNSYAKEDPIVALQAAGFIDLVDEFVDDPYSYVFDGQWGYLDYALGTADAMAEVAGIVEWHINSDEPPVLDYNTNFKPALQLTSLYAPDRFRVSDHDPIVVGLAPVNDPPLLDTGAPYEVEEHDAVTLGASAVDPEGTAVTIDWDFDGDDVFETAGASPSFSAAGLEAPQTVTVMVRATDAWGHATTAEVDIRVIWDFGGFQSPADPAGATSVKAGAALPIKFSLDGFQGLSVLDSAPTFQREQCTTGVAIGAPITTTSSEPFRYTASTDTYTYAWKTQKAWAGWCGKLTVTLDDGETHSLAIRFKP